MTTARCTWCGGLFETSDENAGEPCFEIPAPAWFRPCPTCRPEAVKARDEHRQRMRQARENWKRFASREPSP